MAPTQKGELWVLEQVIQSTDYNFIKIKLMTEKVAYMFNFQLLKYAVNN